MKKLVCVFVFLLFAASAFAFDITSNDATRDVRAGGTVDVQLNLTSDISETVSLSFLDAKTWVSMNVQNVALNPGETKTIHVYISPLLNIQLGLYKISVIGESLKTTELKKSDIFFNVKRGEQVYVEKILVTGNLEPKGYAKVTTEVKSYLQTTVNDVKLNVIVASPTKNIMDMTVKINKIDPMETKSIENVVTLDSLAEAGTYAVYVKTDYQGIVDRAEQAFTVIRKSILTKEYERFSLLLGYGKRIKVTNEGNQVGDDVVYDSVPSVDSVFFYGDKPSTKDGERYGWDIKNLEPGETKVITYYIDYSPLIVFILAIVIALWFFFYKYRTVRIRKYILHKKFIEEGEEFTVGIEIHNGLQKFEEIAVKDFVPPIFKIRDTEGLTPHKKSTSVGTELTWKLREVKRKETRIFTYKVVPIFGVNGTIKLPQASVEFKYAKRNVRNMSNVPEIGIVEGGLPMEQVRNVKKMFRKKKG
jgi:hypothetical protein